MNVESLADYVGNFFARIEARHRVLKNHLHIFSEHALSVAVERSDDRNDLAARRIVEANDRTTDCRFARARFADQPVSFARADRKCDAVDGFDGVAPRHFEVLNQIFDAQQRFAHEIFAALLERSSRARNSFGSSTFGASGCNNHVAA